MTYAQILASHYPENSFAGQCFTFLHKLVDFPSVGNLIGAKKKSLANFGIPIAKLDSFKVGDILLLNYPIFGHGALINCIIGSNLQLTESNFNLDGRVHHTRQITIHDRDILGVFRGTPLYQLPPVNYPLQLKVMILQNNQPFWNSLLQHMANLQNWFWQASGQRIELIIDYKNTNLLGWETEFTGNSIGGMNVEVIKESWYNQYVLPLAAGSDIIIFNMKRDDWKGKVFDHPELMEAGYCYEKVGMTKPIKVFTVSDEHDDYPPYYSSLAAYAKLMAHEICHGLYGLAVSDNFPPGGTDLTHVHFYGMNGYPMKPEDCFSDLDLTKLV